MALMEIQASRLNARVGPNGEPILLMRQNRLLWDRLPIAICLAAFACAILNVYRDSRVGSRLLPAALILAVSSILYWHVTKAYGHENLAPYAAFQVVALAIGGYAAFSPSNRIPGTSRIRLALILYVGGRIVELCQQQIYDRLGADFGHPLKHLMVAFAAFLIMRALYPVMPAMREQTDVPDFSFEAASPD